MAGLKKGTRLTDNPKDYTLRVRMDERTLEKLDVCCKEQGLSRSEVVRKGIDEQYAKTENKAPAPHLHSEANALFTDRSYPI